MVATVCTQGGGEGLRASGGMAGNRACGGSGGAAPRRQSGQSMLLAPDSTVPSLAWNRIFATPVLEQTISMALGWTMGDATATPRYRANHANTNQRSWVMDLRVFMVDQYRRTNRHVLDIHHVWFQDHKSSRPNSCFTLWAARSVLDNPFQGPAVMTFNLPATPPDRTRWHAFAYHVREAAAP